MGVLNSESVRKMLSKSCIKVEKGARKVLLWPKHGMLIVRKSLEFEANWFPQHAYSRLHEIFGYSNEYWLFKEELIHVMKM